MGGNVRLLHNWWQIGSISRALVVRIYFSLASCCIPTIAVQDQFSVLVSTVGLQLLMKVKTSIYIFTLVSTLYCFYLLNVFVKLLLRTLIIKYYCELLIFSKCIFYVNQRQVLQPHLSHLILPRMMSFCRGLVEVNGYFDWFYKFWAWFTWNFSNSTSTFVSLMLICSGKPHRVSRFFAGGSCQCHFSVTLSLLQPTFVGWFPSVVNECGSQTINSAPRFSRDCCRIFQHSHPASWTSHSFKAACWHEICTYILYLYSFIVTCLPFLYFWTPIILYCLVYLADLPLLGICEEELHSSLDSSCSLNKYSDSDISCL